MALFSPYVRSRNLCSNKDSCKTNVKQNQIPHVCQLLISNMNLNYLSFMFFNTVSTICLFSQFSLKPKRNKNQIPRANTGRDTERNVCQLLISNMNLNYLSFMFF